MSGPVPLVDAIGRTFDFAETIVAARWLGDVAVFAAGDGVVAGHTLEGEAAALAAARVAGCQRRVRGRVACVGFTESAAGSRFAPWEWRRRNDRCAHPK